MVSLEFIGLIFTGLSISISIIYYASVIRNQNKTREAQLFMNIYNQWNNLSSTYDYVMSKQWSTFDEYVKLMKTDSEFSNSIRQLSRFFEGLGVLVNRELIDVSYVDDLMSGSTLDFWEKIASVVIEIRKMSPSFQEWNEYLYVEVRKIYDSQHPEFKDKRAGFTTPWTNR